MMCCLAASGVSLCDTPSETVSLLPSFAERLLQGVNRRKEPIENVIRNESHFHWLHTNPGLHKFGKYAYSRIVMSTEMIAQCAEGCACDNNTFCHHKVLMPIQANCHMVLHCHTTDHSGYLFCSESTFRELIYIYFHAGIATTWHAILFTCTLCL